MEPQGTVTLTEYSIVEFQSKITRSHLLLKKDETRPNIQTEIS